MLLLENGAMRSWSFLRFKRRESRLARAKVRSSERKSGSHIVGGLTIGFAVNLEQALELEARAANEKAIELGLLSELMGVFGFHAATVKNGHRPRLGGAEDCGQLVT